VKEKRVLLTHGSGGLAAHALIRDTIVRIFDNPALNVLEDAAALDLGEGKGHRLVMTTDSFVVSPIFFPGGDIGKLAVCGTVNDLATSGARPLAISVGLILEEGLSLGDLDRILLSMKETADSVPVPLVTGDTKVVEKGRGDLIYINTTGVGEVPQGISLSPGRIEPGDAVMINGPLGNHEAAIYASRGYFSYGRDAPGSIAPGGKIESDCTPLSSLMEKVLDAAPGVRCARDPTRGGVAAVLTEIAETRGCTVVLDEEALPVDPPVQALCDILGLDPLFMANEGKMVLFVPPEEAERCLSALRSMPGGGNARKIGEVTAAGPGGEREGDSGGDRAAHLSTGPPRLVMKTRYGTRRIITLPVGSQLPRIC
jgi:hydrogenase expression/formation protein HypE